MPYPTIEKAKEAGFMTVIDGVALTLPQVNALAEMYDAVKAEGDVESPMAVAVAQFKKSHVKSGNEWKARTSEAAEDTNTRWYEACEAGDVTLLEEAAPDGTKVPRLLVTVIREGFSANFHQPFNTRRHKYRRYYTAQAVADVAEAINGKSAYVGDPTQHGAPKTLRDSVVGVFENGRVEEADGRKLARSEIKIYPDQMWIADRARVNPRAFGPSIEADGDVVRGIKEGRDAAIVESVTEISGALLVENPAAGGALERILESEQTRKREKRGEKKMLSELNEAERAEVVAEARKLVESEYDVKAKDAKIKELEEANKVLEDEKKANEAKLAEAKSRELLEAAFPSELPQVSKDRLYELCKGETDAAKIAEAVKKEAEYVAAVSGGVVVAGASAKIEPPEKASLTEAEQCAKEAFGLVPPPDKK